MDYSTAKKSLEEIGKDMFRHPFKTAGILLICVLTFLVMLVVTVVITGALSTDKTVVVQPSLPSTQTVNMQGNPLEDHLTLDNSTLNPSWIDYNSDFNKDPGNSIILIKDYAQSVQQTILPNGSTTPEVYTTNYLPAKEDYYLFHLRDRKDIPVNGRIFSVYLSGIRPLIRKPLDWEYTFIISEK